VVMWQHMFSMLTAWRRELDFKNISGTFAVIWG